MRNHKNLSKTTPPLQVALKAFQEVCTMEFGLEYAAKLEDDSEKCDLLRSIIRRHYYGTADPQWLVTESARSAVNYDAVARYTSACRWVVPWAHRHCNLNGTKILDIGAGTGSTTAAFAHLADFVWGYEIEPKSVTAAAERFALLGLDNCYVRLVNPPDLLETVKRQHSDGTDLVLLYAVLEHLTQEERIECLSTIWHQILRPGGHLVVVDTPNRLSYFDAHTSEMPFFHLLSPHLALQYFSRSSRAEFVSGMRDVMKTSEDPVTALHRWGLGASFHEFEIAFETDSLDGLIVANGFEPEMINWFPPTLEDRLLVTYFIEKELQQNIGFARSALNFIFKKSDGTGAVARPLVNKSHISTLIDDCGLDRRLSGKLLPSEPVTHEVILPTQLREENLKLRAELAALKASSSWRITAPIRGLKTALVGVLRNIGL
jgi:S-adenosylmethionine-dependent methyltransferase